MRRALFGLLLMLSLGFGITSCLLRPRGVLAVAPQITLTSPVGGEDWVQNANHAITWTTVAGTNPITSVKLEYSTDSGSTWFTIGAAGALANTGTFTWNTDKTAGIGVAAMKIRATVTDGSLTGTSTSGAFTVEPGATDGSLPTIAVTSPNGAQTWRVGTTNNITWTATTPNGAGTGVALDYSANGGSTWTSIATGVTAASPYAWVIPAGAAGTQMRVRATVADALSNTASDSSDANNTVRYIIVTSAGSARSVVGTGLQILSKTVAAGDTLYVLFAADSDSGTSQPTYNDVPMTAVDSIQIASFAPDGCDVALYAASNLSAQTADILCAMSDDSMNAVMVACIVHDCTATPRDQAANGNDIATSVAIGPTGVTTQATEEVLCFVAGVGTFGGAWAGGMASVVSRTIAGAGGVWAEIAGKRVLATGTQTATKAGMASQEYAGFVETLKEAT